MGLGIGGGCGGRRAGAGRPKGVKTRWPPEVAAELRRLADASAYMSTGGTSARLWSPFCIASWRSSGPSGCTRRSRRRGRPGGDRPERDPGQLVMAYFMNRGFEPAGEPFATIEIACQRYGFDLIEIRRRNLAAPEAMEYRNPLSLGYDSGPASAAEEPVMPGFCVVTAPIFLGNHVISRELEIFKFATERALGPGG
jgi:hypothetical protein